MLTDEQTEKSTINFPYSLDSVELRDLFRYIGVKVPAERVEAEGRFKSSREVLEKGNLEASLNYETFHVFRENMVGTDFEVLFGYSKENRFEGRYVGLRLKATEFTFHDYNRRIIGLLEEIRTATDEFFAEKSR